jgi:glucose/arabinose dehydrogenase
LDNKLGDPKLLLDLPAIPESKHNGGVVMIGPDNNVYTIIGNVNAKEHPAYLIDGVLEDKIANEK